MRNLLKESYKAVRKLFTAKHQTMEWIDEVRLPESLYRLLIDGKHTEPRRLYLHEVEGVCELLHLRARRPMRGVILDSKFIEHDVEVLAYRKKRICFGHYLWVINFQSGGIAVAIYAHSKTWEKSDVVPLQEIEPKHVSSSLVHWSEA